MTRVSTTSIALAPTDTGAVGKAWDEVASISRCLGHLLGNHAGARKVSLYPITPSRAESSQPWQFEGGSPEIDTGDDAENIDLDSFYPSHHQSRISPKTDPNSATGGCHPNPAALDREILADCRGWQHDGDLGNGAHHRRNEGV
jgi:hypothetical protein